MAMVPPTEAAFAAVSPSGMGWVLAWVMVSVPLSRLATAPPME
jgi:hypothetical protein